MYMKASKRTLIAGILSASLASSQIASASVSCTGQISYIGLDASGDVVIGLVGVNIHKICNSSSQGAFLTNPTVCRMVHGSLLGNQIAGKTVTLYYNDASITSCSQIGAWSIQPSFYFLQF